MALPPPLKPKAAPTSQATQAPASASTAHATVPALPKADNRLVGHDSADGQLTQLRKIGEFDKSELAPVGVDKLVAMAFPAPSSQRYTDDEQLQLLLNAAEDAIARRSTMDAKSTAAAIIERTQHMPNGATAIGVLPPAALRCFFQALTMGYAIDVSRVQPAKPESVKKLAAKQEAADFVGTLLGDEEEDDDLMGGLSFD